MNPSTPLPTFYRGYAMVREGAEVVIYSGQEEVDRVQNMGLARALINEWHNAQ